ncbi:hypothetical protein WH87_12925 [Devosia epidermidihirudinis]|uniref:ABC transporter domain-containing protein n=1 Tax=Devosia epidermidihirudinis TaxID=1293439 RepID=A0A0F5Q8T9_9HYPH|nr:sn-glycerol-3-phosphate ABC transporter ATP-binding protein UgpC [Devosia epidermidihirudinis]KKC37422.1 hypothetical protein WH87_12925 [Devosia epidermidihirudinis]
MADVQLSGVQKAYEGHRVLHGIDLAIEDGAFCVFVGPSGCGKSTLLRMIAGLEEVTAGVISIGGAEVNDTDPADRGVAMVFQSYALYPHMNVAENMGFGLRMTGTPRAEIDRRVSAAAETLRIGELLRRRPAQLSGGQRQRVAIGRAITRRPEVFLFDEPLSNLDAELRVQMRVEIAKLHKSLGNTMIYVTHDQTEAMTLADKIVVMRAGRVEQAGKPLDLYVDPDNAFVAGFLGSPRMNFLSATVSNGGATLSDGQIIALPPLFASPTPGTALSIGLRPEHFSQPSEPDAWLDLKVDVTEHLGGTSFVYARGPGGEEVIIEQRGAAPEQDQIRAGFRVADVLVFDADGQRIR